MLELLREETPWGYRVEASPQRRGATSHTHTQNNPVLGELRRDRGGQTYATYRLEKLVISREVLTTASA